MPIALKRLQEIPEGAQRRDTDPEWIMVQLWEKVNIPDGSLNLGQVPLDTILHMCSGDCKPKHHYVRPLNPDHVRVAAATVQWLATNVGRSFYQRFLDALEKARKPPEND